MKLETENCKLFVISCLCLVSRTNGETAENVFYNGEPSGSVGHLHKVTGKAGAYAFTDSKTER